MPRIRQNRPKPGIAGREVSSRFPPSKPYWSGVEDDNDEINSLHFGKLEASQAEPSKPTSTINMNTSDADQHDEEGGCNSSTHGNRQQQEQTQKPKKRVSFSDSIVLPGSKHHKQQDEFSYLGSCASSLSSSSPHSAKAKTPTSSQKDSTDKIIDSEQLRSSTPNAVSSDGQSNQLKSSKAIQKKKSVPSNKKMEGSSKTNHAKHRDAIAVRVSTDDKHRPVKSKHENNNTGTIQMQQMAQEWPQLKSLVEQMFEGLKAHGLLSPKVPAPEKEIDTQSQNLGTKAIYTHAIPSKQELAVSPSCSKVGQGKIPKHQTTKLIKTSVSPSINEDVCSDGIDCSNPTVSTSSNMQNFMSNAFEFENILLAEVRQLQQTINQNQNTMLLLKAEKSMLQEKLKIALTSKSNNEQDQHNMLNQQQLHIDINRKQQLSQQEANIQNRENLLQEQTKKVESAITELARREENVKQWEANLLQINSPQFQTMMGNVSASDFSLASQLERLPANSNSRNGQTGLDSSITNDHSANKKRSRAATATASPSMNTTSTPQPNFNGLAGVIRDFSDGRIGRDDLQLGVAISSTPSSSKRKKRKSSGKRTTVPPIQLSNSSLELSSAPSSQDSDAQITRTATIAATPSPPNNGKGREKNGSHRKSSKLMVFDSLAKTLQPHS